jgi:hypothetical protein
MKRFSTTLAVSLAISMVVVACASMQSGGRDPVTRAVSAQGGADALDAVKTISYKATVRQWEPEQSAIAGGEMRLANDSTLVTVTDVAAGTTRNDWVRNFQYPAPRTFTFSEIVTAQAGYVAGIDSNGRTKQSREANPPAHSMSGLRLAAASYRTAGDQTLTVLFDPATGLPARVRSLDYDNIWGDVTYDLVLADWQTVGGARIAMSRKYELTGRTIMHVKLSETTVNTPIPADRLAIPAPFLAAARKPAMGQVPYQWIIRRQFIGTYLDSEQPSYDTQGSPGLKLEELAPGIQHVVGGSHNSLIVEMKDYVIVFDAPVSDWQSTWTISAARGKYVRKPVKYLVLTHHHMDHAGGIRAYADAGATIVTGQGTAAHFRRVLAAPFTRNPVLSQSDLSYIPDAKIGFVTDIWSPGAGPLPDKLNPALAALVAGVKKAGIAPAKFAGGHGGNADYAPLAALEGK